MAFPRKKSRTITVDDVVYDWLVGPNDGFSTFVAQKKDTNGRIIKVYFDTDIHAFWVKFPYVNHLNLKFLMPKDAASIIRQALVLGWEPEVTGVPMAFDWVAERLVKRERIDRRS